MISCPSCGRENEDHYRFCLGCGSPLPQQPSPAQSSAQKTIACPHCGQTVPEGFKFCGACGGSLQEPDASVGGEEKSGASANKPLAKLNISPPNLSSASSSSSVSIKKPTADETLSTTKPDPVFAREQEGRTSQHGPRSGSGSQVGLSREEEAQKRAVAQLVVIRPDGSEGTTIPLNEGAQTIGRATDNATLSSDPFLSPEHASVEFSDGVFTIKDLNSLNGIFYRIKDEVELRDGDLIRLGQELLRFQSISSLSAVARANSGEGTAEILRIGSPDRGYWGRLSVICGPDVVTRAFLLNESEVAIGREVGSILFRDDGFVSGRHACVRHNEDGVFLKDLGSSNGTYLRVRGERRLEDGDLILMGQQLFRLVA